MHRRTRGTKLTSIVESRGRRSILIRIDITPSIRPVRSIVHPSILIPSLVWPGRSRSIRAVVGGLLVRIVAELLLLEVVVDVLR